MAQGLRLTAQRLLPGGHEPRSPEASSIPPSRWSRYEDLHDHTTISATERFGLQSQLRRAAVSAACNIVEGCARRGTNEYLNFLNIAAGSASESRYLVELSCRLVFLNEKESQAVTARYSELAARLGALINSLSREA
jgi:four helix bundle protein